MESGKIIYTLPAAKDAPQEGEQQAQPHSQSPGPVPAPAPVPGLRRASICPQNSPAAAAYPRHTQESLGPALGTGYTVPQYNDVTPGPHQGLQGFQGLTLGVPLTSARASSAQIPAGQAQYPGGGPLVCAADSSARVRAPSRGRQLTAGSRPTAAPGLSGVPGACLTAPAPVPLRWGTRGSEPGLVAPSGYATGTPCTDRQQPHTDQQPQQHTHQQQLQQHAYQQLQQQQQQQQQQQNPYQQLAAGPSQQFPSGPGPWSRGGAGACTTWSASTPCGVFPSLRRYASRCAPAALPP